MFARIITCTIQPAKINEFRTLLNDKVLPVIQSQPGFMENIEALDPITGQFSCTTLWKSREDVERYDNGVFPDIASKMSPMLQANPVVQTLPVENSSMHRVMRAAAGGSSR